MDESDSNSMQSKRHHKLNYKGDRYIGVSLNKMRVTLRYQLLTLVKACAAGAGDGDGDGNWKYSSSLTFRSGDLPNKEEKQKKGKDLLKDI